MDSINQLSNVTKLLEVYEKKNPDKLKIVRNTIKSKGENWNTSLKDENGNDVQITEMLLYEYASSIEEITKGNVSFETVIKKLSNHLEKFRFENWRESDFGLPYGKTLYDAEIKVGTPEYEKATQNFGGATLTYYNRDENEDDKNKLIQNAIVLFDNKARPGVGEEINDLSLIRQVIYHEWTHVMEQVVIQETEENRGTGIQKVKLGEGGLPPADYNDNGRKFINAEKLKDGKSYLFTGVSTKEMVPVSKKYPDGIKMHNQFTEGFVEFIAKKVIETLGKKPETFGIEKYMHNHYFEHMEMAERIITARGEVDTISDFITNSAKLIGEFENKRVIGVDINGNPINKDGLRYMSDYITDTHNGETDKMKSLRPMGDTANLLEISKKDQDEIKNSRFWSTYNLTSENKENLKELIFSLNTSKFTKENITGVLDVFIEKYEIELKREKEFMDEVPVKLGYKLRDMKQNKNQSESGKNNKDDDGR